jgi:hypothetical protein
MQELAPVLCALMLMNAPAARAEGEYIRAFYSDDAPQVLEPVEPHMVGVSTQLQTTTMGTVVSGGRVLAAPVVTRTPATKVFRVSDGHYYIHPAFPNTRLWWTPRIGRWMQESLTSPTGWAFVRNEWQLPPP